MAADQRGMCGLHLRAPPRGLFLRRSRGGGWPNRIDGCLSGKAFFRGKVFMSAKKLVVRAMSAYYMSIASRYVLPSTRSYRPHTHRRPPALRQLERGKKLRGGERFAAKQAMSRDKS